MKRTLLFLGMFLSMLAVSAEENVLQSIEIVPVKDTYNIVLVSDKAVDVKKTVKAPNQITLNITRNVFKNAQKKHLQIPQIFVV